MVEFLRQEIVFTSDWSEGELLTSISILIKNSKHFHERNFITIACLSIENIYRLVSEVAVVNACKRCVFHIIYLSGYCTPLSHSLSCVFVERICEFFIAV